MIRWDQCRQNFEPDGALRDIYVHATTIDDWRSLFATLRSIYDLEFFVDCSPREIPATVDEVFATRPTDNPMMRFCIGGISIICHFFTIDEIEFDIDPREVTSQGTLDELLGFFRKVGGTVGKDVLLTYENDPQHPFLSYKSRTREFVWRPS